MRPLFFDTPVIDDQGDVHTLEEYSSGGGGGGSITVDDALSTTSRNPVQNKVITTKINQIEVSIPSVDSALSDTSVNPVQNKVINSALNNKVDAVAGKVLSSNDFTDTLKNKLDGIEAGATAVTVDSALSDTSVNPVQNKVIVEKFNNIFDQSRTEHVIGKTLDGKNIYRCTFTGNHNPYVQSGNRRISSNVIATGIDYVIECSGYITYVDPNSAVFRIPLGAAAIDTNLAVQYTSLVNVSNGNMNIVLMTNQYLSGNGQPFIAVVDYVKL